MPSLAKLLFFICLLLPLQAHAQAQLATGDIDFTLGYTLKSNPLGFGGAYRALADTNDAILLNPAGLAQRQGKLSASGDYVYSGFRSSNAWGVSVSDYKASDQLAMGVAFDRDQFSSGGNSVTVNQLTAAVAREFGETLFGGLSMKYFFSDVSSPFFGGPDAFDLDVGLLAKPMPMFSLGFSLHNVIQGNDLEENPLLLAFGLALDLDPHARLAIDLTRNFQTPAPDKLNAHFGAELRIVESWYIRGGFGLDEVRQNNFYAVGISAQGPKASINGIFSQRLSPTESTFGVNVELAF